MNSQLSPVKILDVSDIEPQSDLGDVCQQLEWVDRYLLNEDEGDLHRHPQGALYLRDPETSLPTEKRFGTMREVGDVVLGGLSARHSSGRDYSDYLPQAVTAFLQSNSEVDITSLVGYSSMPGLWPGGRLGREVTRFTFFEKVT